MTKPATKGVGNNDDDDYPRRCQKWKIEKCVIVVEKVSNGMLNFRKTCLRGLKLDKFSRINFLLHL